MLTNIDRQRRFNKLRQIIQTDGEAKLNAAWKAFSLYSGFVSKLCEIERKQCTGW